MKPVYVAWEIDDRQNRLSDAQRDLTKEQIGQLTQRLDRGLRVFESWVTLRSGALIVYGPGDGCVRVDESFAAEAKDRLATFVSAVEAPSSAGLGPSPHQARKALELAQVKGGDRLETWSSQTEDGIAEIRANQKPKTESDDLASLGKSEKWLAKMTVPLTDKAASYQAVSHPSKHVRYDRVDSYDLGNDTWHHVFVVSDHQQGVLHVLSTSAEGGQRPQDPMSLGAQVSSVTTSSREPWLPSARKVNVPWKDGSAFSVIDSCSRPAGKGYGLKLYTSVAHHHRKLVSDVQTSRFADMVWRKLIHQPGLRGQMGPKTNESHWAESLEPRRTPTKTVFLGGKSWQEHQDQKQDEGP